MSDDTDSTSARDLRAMLIGAEIGRGSARTVSNCRLLPDVVIKAEFAAHSFQNIMEWEIWDRVQSVKHASGWFAPCVQISPCGLYLLQRKTEPIRFGELPEMIPAYFTDLKRENWGMLDGRPVCHDYGLLLATEVGLTKRMKRAHWVE